jgi:hypothetical protein
MGYAMSKGVICASRQRTLCYMRILRQFPTGALVLSLALAVPAAVMADRIHRKGWHEREDDHRGTAKHAAPEFDPSAAGVIVTLVAGGGLLLARRRKS